MKFIPSAVSSKLGRQILKTQKHSPKLLFAAGVVGFGATIVLAVRATTKANDLLDEFNENKRQAELALETVPDEKYTDEDFRRDLAIIRLKAAGKMLKAFGPTVIVGMTSIACLTGSHVILSRRNVALTAAYSALEKGFNEYRKRVIDEYGEDKDREFRYETEKVKIKDEETGKTTTVIKAANNGMPSIYARFFDQACGSSSWQTRPEYNAIFLRNVQNQANDMLRAQGHLFLNEVYDLIGLDRSKAGAVVGWVIGDSGDNFVDFGIFNGDRPAIRDFVNGREASILLDFNVDGVIYDKI